MCRREFGVQILNIYLLREMVGQPNLGAGWNGGKSSDLWETEPG